MCTKMESDQVTWDVSLNPALVERTVLWNGGPAPEFQRYAPPPVEDSFGGRAPHINPRGLIHLLDQGSPKGNPWESLGSSQG